jgi:hypothetical protein
MTHVGRGLDLVLSLVGVAGWTFAVFAIGNDFVARPVAGFLSLGLGLSALALILSSYLQDNRTRRLAANLCPRCGGPIAVEHRHRRWDTSRSEWLAPLTAWECSACGYNHNESWACPTCPAPA